jgi:hypothetical protein
MFQAMRLAGIILARPDVFLWGDMAAVVSGFH